MKTPLELGEILKAARVQQNLNLAELSLRTGLPEKYLHALERGAHDELPGRAYARIYYLNYARALKLDYEGLMQAWPQPTRPPEPAVVQRGWGMFVWLGIPIAALAIWGIFRGAAPVTERGTESAATSRAEPKISADSAGQPALSPDADSFAMIGVLDTAPRPPAADKTPAHLPPVRHRLTLAARAASWVVIEADGDTVAAETLIPGRTLIGEATFDFVLTILLPSQVDATLDDSLLEMPNGGLRPLLRYRIALHNPEGGP